MPEKLNKVCDVLLCVLYREYLTRRAHGVPFAQSAHFRDDVSIREDFLPSWPLEDVTDFCGMLRDRGFLVFDEGDDRAIDVELTPEGISLMDDRFHRRVDQVVSYLDKLAALIP